MIVLVLIFAALIQPQKIREHKTICVPSGDCGFSYAGITFAWRDVCFVMKIGRWTLLSLTKKGNRKAWNCICDCGTKRIVESTAINSGGSLSCGCLAREITAKRNSKHNQSIRGKVSPTYRVWRSVIQRCYDPKSTGYHRYGGRGISVCRRWRHSFVNFLKDMGPRPSGMSIDRIQNAKGYSPSNCKWATPIQQSNNRRSNCRFTFEGMTRTVAEWSRATGIKAVTIKARIEQGFDGKKVMSKTDLRRR